MSTKRRVSRLEKIEAKRARRTILTYTGLTVGLIVILFLFGVGAISSGSEFVVDFFGNEAGFVLTDNTPPAPPRIDTPDDYTSEDEVRITGSAETGATVKIITNGKSKDVIVDAGGTFTTQVELDEGENEISAFTIDQAGNESTRTQTYRIVFDNDSPELTISRPEDGASFSGRDNQKVTIEGNTDEETRITINDRFVLVDDDNTFTYDYSLNEGENELLIKATDLAGNTVETTLRLSYQP